MKKTALILLILLMVTNNILGQTKTRDSINNFSVHDKKAKQTYFQRLNPSQKKF